MKINFCYLSSLIISFLLISVYASAQREAAPVRGIPFSIVMNINGDPAKEMAFNWFTNAGLTGGKVQFMRGIAKDEKKFTKRAKTITARSVPVKGLNYSVASNGLSKSAGIPDNTKRDFIANKAIVKGLRPETTYSYRVGNEDMWSEKGTFTTAGKKVEEFSFIYTTDPQANTSEMFNISQLTTHAAFRTYPESDFWISCGDNVQTSGANNSEWEWEQFFSTQQDLFLKTPFAPVLGNHDKSPNRNFTYHFNTDSVDFDHSMSTTPGSVYSFRWGNALFLALSFEEYSKPGYLELLAKWIRARVNENPDAKWRIAYYHKTIYTGAGHQDDSDGKIIRDRIAPLFDSLKIDLALQGHDHVYELIGPVKNKQLVAGAVSGQTSVAPDPRENVTGKLGGIYNVSEGTLYFLNNSAGKKKYEPLSKAKMDSIESKLGVSGYFGLFTGRFGQTGKPTFSSIKVTRDTIFISTHEVSDEGTSSLFDKVKLVK